VADQQHVAVRHPFAEAVGAGADVVGLVEVAFRLLIEVGEVGEARRSRKDGLSSFSRITTRCGSGVSIAVTGAKEILSGLKRA
jgi:hypothetical protein